MNRTQSRHAVYCRESSALVFSLDTRLAETSRPPRECQPSRESRWFSSTWRPTSRSRDLDSTLSPAWVVRSWASKRRVSIFSLSLLRSLSLALLMRARSTNALGKRRIIPPEKTRRRLHSRPPADARSSNLLIRSSYIQHFVYNRHLYNLLYNRYTRLLFTPRH